MATSWKIQRRKITFTEILDTIILLCLCLCSLIKVQQLNKKAEISYKQNVSRLNQIQTDHHNHPNNSIPLWVSLLMKLLTNNQKSLSSKSWCVMMDQIRSAEAANTATESEMCSETLFFTITSWKICVKKCMETLHFTGLKHILSKSIKVLDSV